MYSTAKDVHIAIQSGLNQINSNRKRTFRPEEIDAAFNQAMFKFIEERSVVASTFNGLNETVKRIDDLSDLTVIDKPCTIYTDTSRNIQYLYSPVDYYKFQDLQVNIDYDCNDRTIQYLDKPIVLNIIPFNPTDVGDFNNFELKLSTGTSLYKSSDFGLNTLNNINSKFMIVNSVLENVAIRRTTAVKPRYDIYWETFGGFKYDNCFIIITDFNSPNYFTLVYGSNTETSQVYEIVTKIPDIPSENYKLVPTEILNTKYKNDALNNYYYNKNRHIKPYIYFTYNDIIIQNVKGAVFNAGYLTYIKRPILLNLRADSMTDFKSHIQEIIDLTITNLSLNLLGSAEANAAISNNNRQ